MNFKKIIFFLSFFSMISTNAITITASKQDFTYIESSSTIDLIDENKKEISSINDVQDLSSVSSNVNISGIGNRHDRTFTIRGISNYVTFESSVALYFDDIAIPFSFGYDLVDFNDIQKVELLKGPQGTLYGKNTESGVISFYSNPISKDFSAKNINEIATYNTYKLYLSGSGYINDKTGLFISGSKYISDGFSKNTFTNKRFDYKDSENFHIKLRYDFNENSNITLNHMSSQSDDGGAPFKLNTMQNPYRIDNEKISDFLKAKQRLTSMTITSINDEIKFTSATSITSQRVEKKDYVNILNGLLIDSQIDVEEVNQEFRLKYDGGAFKFLSGMFYAKKTRFDYYEDMFLINNNLHSKNDLDNHDENYGAYANTQYFSENSLIYEFGLRFQETQRELSRDMNNFGTATTHYEDKKSWSHILPLASLSYLDFDGSKYGIKYAKGYRPGGFNYRNTTVFKPQNTDSYELNYKKMFRDSKLGAAIFYNDIKDLRINTFDDNLATTTLNADSAYSYGVEIDFDYSVDNLDLYSSFGYTKGVIKTLNSNPQYEGNNIIDVPDITASIGSKYKFDRGYYLQSSIKYVGKKYYDISNSAKSDPYTTANTAIGFEHKNLDSQFYVNNIFNDNSVDFMISTPSNKYYHFSDPRVVGVKVKYRF